MVHNVTNLSVFLETFDQHLTWEKNSHVTSKVALPKKKSNHPHYYSRDFLLYFFNIEQDK